MYAAASTAGESLISGEVELLDVYGGEGYRKFGSVIGGISGDDLEVFLFINRMYIYTRGLFCRWGNCLLLCITIICAPEKVELQKTLSYYKFADFSSTSCFSRRVKSH